MTNCNLNYSFVPRSYIDIVAGLAVTNEGHIVAVDSVSPTVFVISEDGDLVHWFDCSDHMREPSDIAISGEFDFFFFFLARPKFTFTQLSQKQKVNK